VVEVVGLIAGALLALGYIRLARSFPARTARLIYCVGLGFTALAYGVFSLFGRASIEWLGYEALGLVLFGVLAWVGFRYSLLLALGWAAHVLWDLLLHLNGPGAAYTPDWYPWLCVSFDLLVAAAVLLKPQK
jgi:hypothetical protein